VFKIIFSAFHFGLTNSEEVARSDILTSSEEVARSDLLTAFVAKAGVCSGFFIDIHNVSKSYGRWKVRLTQNFPTSRSDLETFFPHVEPCRGTVLRNENGLTSSEEVASSDLLTAFVAKAGVLSGFLVFRELQVGTPATAKRFFRM